MYIYKSHRASTVGAQKLIECLGLGSSAIRRVGHRQQATRQGGPHTYIRPRTYQHLIHDGPQAPPVTLHAITLLQEHFWSNVVWSAHSGESQLPPVALPVLQLLCLQPESDNIVEQHPPLGTSKPMMR
jgi:hypothetical protein